jgi:hypothetical protein
MVKKEVNKSKIGTVSIVLGAISFIPLIGLFTGIAAIILGIIDIKKNKSKLGIIGLVLGIIGILITIGLYLSLFYFGFVQRGGIYDELRIKMVQEQQLPNTINAIEAYNARFGKYPDKISDLKQISSDPWIYLDQLQFVKQAFNGQNESEQTYFYYENRGNTYYLFSKGVDGQPFTQDDIFPLANSTIGNIGYRHP